MIGAVLTKASDWFDRLAAEIRHAKEFRLPQAQIAWEAFIWLDSSRMEITPQTVREWVSTQKDLIDCKPEFLIECIDAIHPRSKPVAMAKIVHAKYLGRELEVLGRSFQSEARMIGADATEVLEEAQRRIMSLGEQIDHSAVVPQLDALKASWELLERRIERVRSNLAAEFRWGFPTLDRMTHGLHANELTIIGARPGVGKTIFGIHLCRQAALQGVPVMMFALEQPKEELMFRLAACHASASGFGMRSGKLSNEDLDRLHRHYPEMERWPIFWSDNPNQTATRICAATRREKKRNNIGLVIIDYLQLLGGEGSKKRWEQVGDMSRKLKILSRELQIPVVAMAQLNRQNTTRTDPRPKMSDLREAGNIEQDADNVILLHPETKTENEKDQITVILEKQRSGPSGEFVVEHHKRFFRFQEPKQELT